MAIAATGTGRSVVTRVAAIVSTAAVTAATVSVATLGTANAQTAITWEECPVQVTDTNAQCGRIDVPMYHSDPDGATISVGFVKVPAADQANKRGALFGNAGGPGGDAYSFFGTPEAYAWPQEIRNEWDLVAVQPRGLYGSTPVDCNNIAEYDFVSMVTREGAFVRDSCEIGTPGYTASLTTDNTADDWEWVRRALGEEQISILGLSYGTVLGSVYASRYPQNTDRVVLDSGINPNLAWNGVMAVQEPAYINALHDFFDWAAENNDAYGLGATPLAAYQAWSNRIVAETGTNPTVSPPPAQVGDVPPAFSWAGQAGADAMNAVGPTGVQLQGLATQILNPGANQANGSLLAATRGMITQPSAWPMLADMIAGNQEIPSYDLATMDQNAVEQQTISINMQRMVMCNENQVAPNPGDIPRFAWTGFVTGDIFTSASTKFTSGQACSGMDPVTSIPAIDGSQLDVRPLQLQGTGDPQTPYAHFGEMAAQMNSHVVTVDGAGHGQVGMAPNPAVDNIVVDYLRTGHTEATHAPGYVPSAGEAAEVPVVNEQATP